MKFIIKVIVFLRALCREIYWSTFIHFIDDTGHMDSYSIFSVEFIKDSFRIGGRAWRFNPFRYLWNLRRLFIRAASHNDDDTILF